ncbi:hypothetical protein LOZ39_004369 [Ophidiomyces ophidiicola]|nr:hypothetical protein LOZ49_002940 [Ophidiomyces ophidiicola]KAI2012599.1 hypothetical protein LOZ50_000056 [Ophidiomyces ophidiicola]KAI2053239.1 hypothetical protein LOZ44_002726 [Ophidiomyces ophidiicola]KAI2072157.1 hypothetical protein LOZ39_004369 [Ophidiomyces ophidiicola]KAI2133617.1 hypothetical protein LOZ29_004574 [Ophidiomyces ophidiicola]
MPYHGRSTPISECVLGRQGGHLLSYEIHPRIVVKVPKPGDFEREQFRKEVQIYRIFSKHPPCPSLVQPFSYSDSAIFLEYMRDECLSFRIQQNNTRDLQTRLVTSVEKLEPLHLRKEWMNDLAQGVAFLESLNLAHGDLRPENILLDRNRLKLSDFDCAAKIGECFEACIPPYGRVLGSNESKYGLRGSAGLLGPRTEQFALGSLYYLINYGFEVYGDQRLTQDLNNHGSEVVRLLQEMEFPKLDGDARLDEIIDKCWHNKYATIAELAVDTERLRDKTTHDTSTNKLDAAEDYGLSAEEFLASKRFCQDIESRGLIHLLSSAEPKEMGFTFNPTFARLN